MTDEIQIRPELEGRVAVIELCRERARNALTLEMMRTLAGALAQPPNEAGCVLLCGAGSAFCAGVDGTAVRQAIDAGWSPAFEELLEATHTTLRALIECPIPVIAAVDGSAAGAGCTYALLADIRIVTGRTKLVPGHLSIGSPLDGGSSYALKRALGPVAAMQLLLAGNALSGEDLIALGLAGAPMSSPDDLEAWLSLADQIAASDPVAVVSARDLLQTTSFAEQWAAEVAWLRRFIESGRLLENMNRYWESHAASAN